MAKKIKLRSYRFDTRKEVKKVLGKPLTLECLPGIEFFWYCPGRGANYIIEVSTGLLVVGHCSTLKKAKRKLQKVADKRGIDGFQKAIAAALVTAELEAIKMMEDAKKFCCEVL